MTTISSSQEKNRLLHSALLGNSIFCFLSGLDFTLFSRPVAEFLGLPSSVVILALGIGLIAYTLVVFLQSRAQPLNLPFVRFDILADILWVIGSTVLVFTNLVAFTSAANGRPPSSLTSYWSSRSRNILACGASPIRSTGE